jgi:hypothetical protein
MKLENIGKKNFMELKKKIVLKVILKFQIIQVLKEKKILNKNLIKNFVLMNHIKVIFIITLQIRQINLKISVINVIDKALLNAFQLFVVEFPLKSLKILFF